MMLLAWSNISGSATAPAGSPANPDTASHHKNLFAREALINEPAVGDLAHTACNFFETGSPSRQILGACATDFLNFSYAGRTAPMTWAQPVTRHHQVRQRALGHRLDLAAPEHHVPLHRLALHLLALAHTRSLLPSGFTPMITSRH